MPDFEIIIGPSRRLKYFILTLYITTALVWLWLPLLAYSGYSSSGYSSYSSTGYLLPNYSTQNSFLFWFVAFLIFVIKLGGCGFLYYHFRKTSDRIIARIHKNSVIRIGQNTSQEWWLQTRDGSLAKAQLKNDSFKSQWIFILRFRLKCRSLSVIIPVDAVSSSEFRLLSGILNHN